MEEHEANARLIAASPDLLAALRDIVTLAYRDPNRKRPTNIDDYAIASVLVDQARAAIAKAGAA